ncbi:hypothetical protein Tco_1195011 [Tanacetum coccineum]
MIVIMSMIELESLFGPLFDEYFNGENQVVSKSSAVTTADVSDKRQQQSDSTSSTSTLATTITADGNFDIEELEKGIMLTKIQLTLEQSQQGVSNDVLVSIEGAQDDQESQIKMIQVKKMMQDKDLKLSKSKDEGSRSISLSMKEQSHYIQEKKKTRPKKKKLKRHIFNIGENKVKSR